MMTSERIRATIERLKELTSGCRIYTSNEVVNAVSSVDWVGSLIELLEQADPETHLCVPRDADGVPIRIGDELCGYGRPDGGVYCMATNGAMVYVGEIDEFAPKEWMTWCADQCRHYHKPTIEELLREFASEWFDVDDDSSLVAEYADKLRELVKEEQQ